MSKARVFALAPSQFDNRNAEEYGELVYLFGQGKRLPSPLSPVFAEEVWNALRINDYDPDTDYLLIAGSQAALVQWIAAVISQVMFCRALLFDAVKNLYVLRILGFEHEVGGERKNEARTVGSV